MNDVTLSSLECREHPQYHFYCSRSAELRKYFSDRSAPEHITHCAIRHPDKRVFCVLAPGRHHHVVRLMAELGMAGRLITEEQGYLTSYGRYVDRYEAKEIAMSAQQLLPQENLLDALYSDDLW